MIGSLIPASSSQQCLQTRRLQDGQASLRSVDQVVETESSKTAFKDRLHRC